MKKTIILSLFLFVISCNNRDYLINDDENLSNRPNTNVSGKILCAPYYEPTVEYGNPNNYPKWNMPTYYNLTNPNNEDNWFFDVVKRVCNNYFFEKYGVMLANWNVGSFDYPGGIQDVRILAQSYDRIYPYDGSYYELYPDRTVSAAATTYAIYRILSSIDQVINYVQTPLKPVAITFAYDVTMCGDYLGLYYHVYYAKR